MFRTDDPSRPPLGDRLRSAIFKPTEPDAEKFLGRTAIGGKLEAAVKADDKERLIGLLAAPFAAVDVHPGSPKA